MFSFYKKKLFTPNTNISKYILESTNESMRKKINYYNNEKKLNQKLFDLKENTNKTVDFIVASSSTFPYNFDIISLFLFYMMHFLYNKYKNKLNYK